jgi:hypothetical protein
MMGRYLTAAQYKLVDDGILDLPDDEAIERAITRAEAAIDAYVGVDARYGGFQPHQQFYQAQFVWTNRRVNIPTWPIPIRNVSRFRIQVSNGNGGQPFVANIDPGDVVINSYDGYLEIVPLQAITYSLAPVMMQLGLQPPILLVDAEVGYYFPEYGERLINSGNNQTFRTRQGFWALSYTNAINLTPLAPPITPPVIYNNGVPIASALYTIDPVEGQITFNTPMTPPFLLTIDYTYTIPDNIVAATVLQTTDTLGQRMLHKAGVVGMVTEVRNGDQIIRMQPRGFQKALAPLATQILDEAYNIIPIG